MREKVNSERACRKLASFAQTRVGTKNCDGEGERIDASDLDQLVDDLGLESALDQAVPDQNAVMNVPGRDFSSESARGESGRENERDSDKKVLLQEIQQTLDGTLMLSWVNSAGDQQLSDEYDALLQIDKWLVDVVSDESKTSHFSLLPGSHSSVSTCA